MLVFSALSLLAQDAIRYISYSDGRVYAIPQKYILSETKENGVVTLVLEGDATFTYNESEVAVSEEFNSTVNPTLTSYGFTNADNDQVYADVDATITEDGDRIVVNADVPVIGKRLRPSFELSEGFSMWLGAEKQQSGVSSHRFEEPTIFTLAPENHLMYSDITKKVSQDEWIYTKIDPSTAFTNAPSNGFDGKVFSNLWDNDPTTIFHSTWGDGPYTQLNWVNNGYWGDGVTEWPYIQIELPEDIDNFCFKYTTPDYNERVPLGWCITAKVKDTEEWETIASLNYLDDQLPTQTYTPYKSEVYTLEKEYSAVRLELTNAPYKNYLVLSDIAFYTRKKNDTPLPKEMGFVPFGRECEVNVKYLTDHATGDYKIPTVHITFGDGETWNEDQWIGMYTYDEDGNYVWTKEEWIKDCTFQLDGAGVWPDIDKVEGCEVRGRGNSSWSQSYMSKNPFRIKFPKKKKQSPFNLTEDRQWVFIANKQNGSMTSNSIAQKVAAMVDAEALCHMIPVDVYINGHYRGSYCFTEKIGIADNSVAIDETTGCLLELDDYYDEDFRYKDPTYNLPVNVKDPDFSEEDEKRQVTFDGIMESFNNMTSSLYNGEDITRHIDMESWAKFWLVNDLVRNAETHHPKSCYLFNPDVPGGEKWKFGPAWDFDWAFGYEETYTYFIYGAEEDLFSKFAYSYHKAGHQFFDALRNSDAGKIAYYKEWTDFMNEGRLEELLEYIDDYTAFASLSIAHNNDADISEKNYTDYEALAERSKEWIKLRANYIYNGIKDLNFIKDVNDVVITDGEDFAQDLAQEVKKLTYNRTLPNLKWNPLYVPFKIPVTSISDKYDVAYINGMHSYDRNNDGTIDELTMEVIKLADGTLKANYPYLIKAKDEAAKEMSIKQEGTVLYPSESTTLSCSSVYTNYFITGTYNEMTAEQLNGSLVITSDGAWEQMDPDQVLKANRLFLSITQKGDSPVEIDQQALSRVSISVLGEETGIFETENGKVKTENCYDLTGRRVQKAQKGIYIVNGKVKIVK